MACSITRPFIIGLVKQHQTGFRVCVAQYVSLTVDGWFGSCFVDNHVCVGWNKQWKPELFPFRLCRALPSAHLLPPTQPGNWKNHLRSAAEIVSGQGLINICCWYRTRIHRPVIFCSICFSSSSLRWDPLVQDRMWWWALFPLMSHNLMPFLRWVLPHQCCCLPPIVKLTWTACSWTSGCFC